MFRTPQFIGSLATMQFFCILAKLGMQLVGVNVSWTWTLLPLWILIGICMLFWVLVAIVFRKLMGWLSA